MEQTAIETWPMAVAAVLVAAVFAALWVSRRQTGEEVGRNPERIARAVGSARRAVAAAPVGRKPRRRARAQMQLVMLLAEAGGRTHNRAMLQEALDGVREAIPVFEAEGLTPELASALYYRGRAEWGLGSLEAGPEGLEVAAQTFRELLQLKPWPGHLLRAVIVSLPAVILMDIGGRKDDLSALEGGVALAREAVSVVRRRVAIDVCIATRNLSHCLGVLGRRSGDAALLEEAVEAGRTAADTIGPKAHPRQWVACQASLGHALGELGKLRGDAALLRESLSVLDAARAAGGPAMQSEGRTMLALNTGSVGMALGLLTGDGEMLARAAADLNDALAMFSEANLPFAAAEAAQMLGDALVAQGNLDAARAQYEAALAVFTEAGAPRHIAEVQTALGRIDGAPAAAVAASYMPRYQVE